MSSEQHEQQQEDLPEPSDVQEVRRSDPSEVMTMRQIAVELGIAPSTARRMVRDGRIDGITWQSGSRKTYRVQRSRFWAWLRQNGYQPNP